MSGEIEVITEGTRTTTARTASSADETDESTETVSTSGHWLWTATPAGLNLRPYDAAPDTGQWFRLESNWLVKTHQDIGLGPCQFDPPVRIQPTARSRPGEFHSVESCETDNGHRLEITTDVEFGASYDCNVYSVFRECMDVTVDRVMRQSSPQGGGSETESHSDEVWALGLPLAVSVDLTSRTYFLDPVFPGGRFHSESTNLSSEIVRIVT